VTSPCRSIFEQRVRAVLTGDEPRIPVVLGLCGTGRTTVLRRLQADLGPGSCQYINVERTATTPERFLHTLTSASPFAESRDVTPPRSPREAFDAVLGFLSGARCADGSRATFLLDEVMEFRTFESFPGLRRALPEMLAVLAASPNRFAAASRYVTRSERALAVASPHFLVAPIQAFSAADVERLLAETGGHEVGGGTDEADGGATVAAAGIAALAGGVAAYARALTDTLRSSSPEAAADPLAALRSALSPGGRLTALCGHSYELRLHRARGYGALKAILEILAEDEPLTLTEISLRLGRTPGSTKDYLSWLDDVDLVAVAQKKYRFRDPLLRVWCRLHCGADQPEPEAVDREVNEYATRVAQA
jgi:hypothetical protein